MRWIAVVCLLSLAACGARSEVELQAVAAFEDFQDALFAQDRAALRGMLTRESRAVVPHLPLGRTSDKQRLEVVASRRADPQVLLSVTDPNEGGALRTFVMVREDGALRVDLVATTGFNHTNRHNPDGGIQILPRNMDPAEVARIRSSAARAIR